MTLKRTLLAVMGIGLAAIPLSSQNLTLGKPATTHSLKYLSQPFAVGTTSSPLFGIPLPPAIDGSGTQNRIAKFTASSTIGDSKIIDDGSRITVESGVDFSSDFSFIGNAEPDVTGRVQMFDRAFAGFVIRGLNVIFETPVSVNPSVSAEIMRVTQLGRVGIGTTAPSQLFEVWGGISR